MKLWEVELSFYNPKNINWRPLSDYIKLRDNYREYLMKQPSHIYEASIVAEYTWPYLFANLTEHNVICDSPITKNYIYCSDINYSRLRVIDE